FAIGILKNESRFRRCDGLALGRRRKKQTAGTDESKMGGKGTGFRHKERDLSSIIAACATGFRRKTQIFAVPIRRYNEPARSAICCRIFVSGNRPVPACILSSRCPRLLVAGIAQVTAGCAMIHFRKNCAQERQSNLAAQSGNGFDRTRLKRSPPPKGRLMITATPRS